jgi:hypothetical protein
MVQNLPELDDRGRTLVRRRQDFARLVGWRRCRIARKFVRCNRCQRLDRFNAHLLGS